MASHDVDQDREVARSKANVRRGLDDRTAAILNRAQFRSWEHLKLDSGSGLLVHDHEKKPTVPKDEDDEEDFNGESDIKNTASSLGEAGWRSSSSSSAVKVGGGSASRRAGLLRYVMVALDLSKQAGGGSAASAGSAFAATSVASAANTVWAGGNRDGLIQNLLDFVTFFHRKNPIAMLGVMLCYNGTAEVVMPISGPGYVDGGTSSSGPGEAPALSKRRALERLLLDPKRGGGYFSLQRVVEAGCAELSGCPAYGQKELLLLSGSLTTHDKDHRKIDDLCRMLLTTSGTADIEALLGGAATTGATGTTTSSDDINQGTTSSSTSSTLLTNATNSSSNSMNNFSSSFLSRVRLHIVSVVPELRILKNLAHSYRIAKSGDDFRDMLLAHLQPPGQFEEAQEGDDPMKQKSATTRPFAYQVRMAFPRMVQRKGGAGGGENNHHSQLLLYECPECFDTTSRLPSKCSTCGIYLIDGTALVESRTGCEMIPYVPIRTTRNAHKQREGQLLQQSLTNSSGIMNGNVQVHHQAPAAAGPRAAPPDVSSGNNVVTTRSPAPAPACWACQQSRAVVCCPCCDAAFCDTCSVQSQLFLNFCPCCCQRWEDAIDDDQGREQEEKTRSSSSTTPASSTTSTSSTSAAGWLNSQPLPSVVARPDRAAGITVIVVDLNPLFWYAEGGDAATFLQELLKFIQKLHTSRHYVSLLSTARTAQQLALPPFAEEFLYTPQPSSSTSLQHNSSSSGNIPQQQLPMTLLPGDYMLLPPVPITEVEAHWPRVTWNLRAGLQQMKSDAVKMLSMLHKEKESAAVAKMNKSSDVVEVEAASDKQLDMFVRHTERALPAVLGKALCQIARFRAMADGSIVPVVDNGAGASRPASAAVSSSLSFQQDSSSYAYGQRTNDGPGEATIFKSREALAVASAAALLQDDEDFHHDGVGRGNSRIVIFDASSSAIAYAERYDALFRAVLAAKRHRVRIDSIRLPTLLQHDTSSSRSTNSCTSSTSPVEQQEGDQHARPGAFEPSILLGQAVRKTGGGTHEIYDLLLSEYLHTNAAVFPPSSATCAAVPSTDGSGPPLKMLKRACGPSPEDTEDDKSKNPPLGLAFSTTSLATVCACHQRLVESGYVCASCLSVCCDFTARCTECGTRFHAVPPEMWRRAVLAGAGP
ncbi:unnamed protein product [Amoebophrya sp. A25]|nr:unnamed protein product [Amoebophrya sp. A25]|eukprot:GSA25T00009577001.1